MGKGKTIDGRRKKEEITHLIIEKQIEFKLNTLTRKKFINQITFIQKYLKMDKIRKMELNTSK